MIVMKSVSKTYRNPHRTVHALADVSFAVERGSFTVVTGASGSGKSTLLFVLGGLVRPTAGSFLFNGADIYAGNDRETAEYRNRSVGFVLQSFNLIPYLTARENVTVPMLAAKTPASKRTGRASAMLDLVGLADRRDFLPRELSVGQQQRVAIARALANDPEMILADEPTGNLDPGLAGEILEMFRKLNAEDGRTIVMATHSPVAARYGTRSLLLENGTCTAGSMA
jgi:putative ABC transport system ATP-binding protein